MESECNLAITVELEKLEWNFRMKEMTHIASHLICVRVGIIICRSQTTYILGSQTPEKVAVKPLLFSCIKNERKRK